MQKQQGLPRGPRSEIATRGGALQASGVNALEATTVPRAPLIIPKLDANDSLRADHEALRRRLKGSYADAGITRGSSCAPSFMKSTVTGLFLCVLLVVVSSALAETPDTVLLEDLTWTEIRDRIKRGTTVIVPIGGTEQNGPHMAVGKHNIRVKALSEKIARTLGNTLVAPVLAYVPEGQVSPPTGHMRFPGTLTVPDDVFQKNVEYAARSLKAHGFRNIGAPGRSRSHPVRPERGGDAAQPGVGSGARRSPRGGRLLPREPGRVSPAPEGARLSR